MNKKNHYRKLIFLILVYGISLLFVAYWSPFPRVVGIVGFVLGITTFYVNYSSRLNGIYLDVSLFVVTLIGSSVATLLLFLACNLTSKPICISSSFQAQALGNFIFPLVFVVAPWVTWRLPVIMKKKK